MRGGQHMCNEYKKVINDNSKTLNSTSTPSKTKKDKDKDRILKSKSDKLVRHDLMEYITPYNKK